MGFVYLVGQFTFFASYTTNTDDSVLQFKRRSREMPRSMRL